MVVMVVIHELHGLVRMMGALGLFGFGAIASAEVVLAVETVIREVIREWKGTK